MIIMDVIQNMDEIESLKQAIDRLREMCDNLAEENYRLRETIVQMAMEAHGK